MCDALRHRILTDGRVSGDLVPVDGFLNDATDTASVDEGRSVRA